MTEPVTERLARYEELGIYDPGGPDAEDRLRLIEYLIELGATEEELVEAHRTSNAGSLALDLVLRRPGPRVTFEEAATRAGLSLDEAARFVRALGFPDPRAADQTLPAENIEHLAIVLGGARELVGTETALALARVLGSTTYRLAETVVGALRTNFEVPQLNSGVPYSEVLRRYVGLARDLLPEFLRAVENVFKDHLVAVASGTWQVDEEGGTDRRELLVGFVDMVGFSSLSRGMPSGKLAKLIAEFEDVVSDLIAAHKGRIVKMIGDGAMFVCEDPEDGCRLALALIDRFGSDARLPQVHIGLAYGPLVSLHGDYFGDAVNVAGRLHDLAPAAKVLVDRGVVEAVDVDADDVSVWLGLTDVQGPIYELRSVGAPG